MAKTVITSATTYCPVSEFLKRVDARVVGDLVSDSGERVASGSLASDANLAAILLDASGMVEAACLVSGRYTPTDLASLTGASLRFLYRLVSDLTLGMLVQRRPDRKYPIPPQYELAMKWLDRLESGERIFGFQEQMDAGVVDHTVETADIVNDRQMTTTHAQRFFSTRTNRMAD